MFQRLRAAWAALTTRPSRSPQAQLEHLRRLVSGDYRWLGHNKVADALTERYLAALAADWHTRVHADSGTFRQAIGLEPNYAGRPALSAVRPVNAPAVVRSSASNPASSALAPQQASDLSSVWPSHISPADDWSKGTASEPSSFSSGGGGDFGGGGASASWDAGCSSSSDSSYSSSDSGSSDCSSPSSAD